MGLGMEIDLTGSRRFARKLSEADRKGRDLSPAFRETAELLRERQREVFETAGRSQGTPWAPLSRHTQEMRNRAVGYYRRAGSGAGILRASGGLMRSYTDPSHPRHKEEIHSDGMEWGSTHQVAHLHASGTGRRGSAPPLPQRELLVFNDVAERRRLFEEPLADHLFRGLSDERAA